MTNFNEIVFQYKNILSYVSQKTGIPSNQIRSDIVGMMEKMERSTNSGFSGGANRSRFDGVVYQFVIMHLLGAKKIEGLNTTDYLYLGQNIEFKLATGNEIKYKVAVRPMEPSVPIFYEHYDKLHFITSLTPPFKVYVISQENLNNYVMKKFVVIPRSISRNETVMGMWKVFLHIPVSAISRLVEETIDL